MKEEILSRLDALALKLGVAVEHLWEILVRQGFVEGVCGAIGLLLGSFGVCVSYKLFKKAFHDDIDDNLAGGCIIAGVIIAILAIIFILIGFFDIQYLFNPEYFALNKVLKIIGE
jgi:hypothetical protein